MKAAYKYQAEDVDELAFEVGEIINVVEYEDTEDQVSYYFGCSLTLSDVGRGGQKGNQ